MKIYILIIVAAVYSGLKIGLRLFDNHNVNVIHTLYSLQINNKSDINKNAQNIQPFIIIC